MITLEFSYTSQGLRFTNPLGYCTGEVRRELNTLCEVFNRHTSLVDYDSLEKSLTYWVYDLIPKGGITLKLKFLRYAEVTKVIREEPPPSIERVSRFKRMLG